MKRGLVALVGLALAATGVVAWVAMERVEPGTTAVRLDAEGNQLAEWGPGVHWKRGPGRTVRFSTDPDTLRFPTDTASPYRLFDSEGNALPVELVVVYRALAGEARTLHSAVGEALLDTLDAQLRLLVRPLASRIAPDATDPGDELARALALRFSIDGAAIEIRASGDGTGAPGETGVHVLLVGIDAGDWKNLDPLLERGELPHLTALLETGTRADLSSLYPMLSPLLWTTVATGTTPDRHGILDFLTTDPATGERIPVTRRQRREPAFWNYLTQFGVSLGVVGWLASWPAEAVSGHFVTDRFGFLAFAETDRAGGDEGMTWPPEYVREARALEVDGVPRDVWRDLAAVSEADLASVGKGGFRPGDLLGNLSLTVSAALTSTAIAEDLQRRFRPRVLAVYYELVDAAGHLVMPCAPPQRPDIADADYARFSGSMDAIYRLQDELLGRLLEGVAEETMVILVSDHGFKSGDDRPAGSSQIRGGEAARWHREPGLLLFSGPGVRAGQRLGGRVDLVDITPTLLTVAGIPVPGGMDGRFLSEMFTEEGVERYSPRLVDEIALRPEVWSPPATTSAEGPAAIASRHNNLGVVLQDQGKLDEAEAEFRKAVAAVPKDRISRTNLAGLLVRTGRLEEAESMLQALVAAYPDNIPSLYNLGLVFQRTGRFVEAETFYRLVVERDPAHRGARVNLGHVVLRQKRTDEAEAIFTEVLRRDPEAANAHFGMGIIAVERKDYPRAAAAFRKTLELDPQHRSAARNLAAVEQSLDGS